MRTFSFTLKVFLTFLVACVCVGGYAGTKHQSPVRVKVLTYNIYHGEDANGGSNLDAVAGIINSLKPDLVALQEVDKNTARAKNLDLTAELSERTGMKGIFGKAMDYDRGGYGEAVLSRYPIIETRNNSLPHTTKAEPRAALEIHVELPGGAKMAFVGTHLDHQRDQTNRMMQTKRIMELYENYDLPMILAGDLNATPGSDPINLLLEQWSDAARDNPQPTFPSTKPSRRIDYVMYKPNGRWKVLQVKVIDEKVASDHCPVFAVLELVPD